MIKVKHITSVQVGSMVGDKLGSELWIKGMFNEIRRYPNEIPCEAGEIPSMLIPAAPGEVKVEWGFAAGMSCLIPQDDGSITVRRAGHFPSCACLALLTLLYEAGAANGKSVSVRLSVPEGKETETFRSLLSQIQAAMKNVIIRIQPAQPEQKPAAEPARTVLDFSNSIAVVQQLQQIDVGRFAARVKCINGSFSVGDDVTVADGQSFRALQAHCPVLQISDAKGMTPVKSSDELDDDDPFWIMFAMWFPTGTMISSMSLVKEVTPPAFTPEIMPPRPSLGLPAPVEKKGFFKRLFG